jgi:hypothetical protein
VTCAAACSMQPCRRASSPRDPSPSMPGKPRHPNISARCGYNISTVQVP